MKKILFSVAAITLLSTAGFANKRKAGKKKQAVKTECVCPANCQKRMDCSKMHS
jgi:hypothetical protein